MADTPAFQGHHVIEQAAYGRSELLQVLSERGLFDLHGPRNIIALPADQALGARMGLSPHPGGPLGAYTDELRTALRDLEISSDGQATLRGDPAAAQRMAARVGIMTDTLKVGLVNGDLVSNTPQGMTTEQANARIRTFFGDLEGYRDTHVGQISELGRMTPAEATWAAVTRTEARVGQALDAIRQPNASTLSPRWGDRAPLGTAVAEANQAGRLPLSEPMEARLRAAFPQQMPATLARPPVVPEPAPQPQPRAPASEPPGTVPRPPAVEPAGPVPAPRPPVVEPAGSAPVPRPPVVEPVGPVPAPRAPVPPGVAPEVPPVAGAGRGVRIAGAAGVALMAYDFVTTGHNVVNLRAQGNEAAAASAETHFVGRNVGGVLGGMGAGFVYGAIAGSETGPGAVVTGLVGAGVGAYLGERWAQRQDIERVYTQTDRNGNEWSRDPAQPQGPWLRTAQVPNAAGGEDTVRVRAAGRLVDELNYRAANDSYSLGLGNPPRPQDPFSIHGAQDQAGWHAGPWQRDAGTGAWSRTLAAEGMLPEHRLIPDMRTDAATPAQTVELERQSALIVAQNAANTPVATAGRYVIAHAQFGWREFEAFEPLPPVIRNAAEPTTATLQASDGNTYTRGGDGQWQTPGMLYGTNPATGNVREELDRTWRSQQEGLQELRGYTLQALANPTPTQYGLREAVAGAYERAGLPARSAGDIDAATRAVAQDHARDGLGKSPYSLRVRPDGAIETLSGRDDRDMQVRSVTTPADIRQARTQPAAPADPAAPTSPGTPAPASGASPPAPPVPDRASLDDPAHPRHAMFGQALTPVLAHDAGRGQVPYAGSVQLAAGMTAEARAGGLETIAFGQFSPDGRRFFMADTPDPSSPSARTAVGDVAQGRQQSLAESSQRVAEIDQAQALAQPRLQSSPGPAQERGQASAGPRLA